MKDQPPRLRSIEAFTADWWAWWRSLQPAERAIDDDGNCDTPSIFMDWSALAKVGANGFLLVMMSLTWWGKLQADSDWQCAVKDVTAVLRSLPKLALEDSPPLHPKRKAPLSENTSQSTKRSKLNIPTPSKSPRRLRSAA